MKPRALLALALLAAPLATALPAASQQAPASVPVIMVVDIQLILQESAAAKTIQKQLDAQRETYQKEIATQEERLRAAEQELTKQRAVLSAEAFAQKRREFEKQVGDVQRAVQTRRRALDQGSQEAMNQVRSSAFEIVTAIASERKATVVLPRHQVLLVEKGLDVTDTVMERLNKKLPTVTVSVPKS